MRPRAISDPDLDRAIGRLRAGEVGRAVAASLGVSPDTLRAALRRSGLTVAELKPAPLSARMGVFIRLAQEDVDALHRYAEARGTTASAVVRAALRAVGVTDPDRAGTVTLDVGRDIGRGRKARTALDKMADRRARVARVVAERGRPVGEPAVRALAAELGINWRVLYRDLAALDRERAGGDDAPSH